VARFLWVVSPLGSVRVSRALTRDRTRFIKSCRKLPFLETCAEIYAYVEDAFADSPASSGEKSSAPSPTSWAAVLVDLFAREYGWRADYVLGIPLKCAFQYLRAITKHHRPDAIFFNPHDRVVGNYLRTLPT
jgi:hypothetical protein